MQRTDGKILAVLSDLPDREVLLGSLSAAGLRCESALGADDALGHLTRGRFDVVLLDLSGRIDDLLRLSAAVERTGAALICAGGVEGEETMLLAMRLGSRDFLRRPFQLEDDPIVRIRRWLLQRPAGASADGDREIKRLKSQYEELRRHLAEQVRSFEDSQETFYLDLSRMMTIIGNIMDGIVFADQNGSVALMNPVAENLLGIKSFIAIGKHVNELAGRRELIKALQEDHRAVQDRKEILRTVEVHHSEHDLLYIKAHTTKILDYRGVFAGVLTVLQDTTAEFKSDQLKNQYLSIVAHELRTPLTGIKTFAAVMSKGALGPLTPRQHEVMQSICEQSLRLEHQIDKLINLGQLDSNAFAQDLGEFDVDEFLTVAIAPFEQPAKDRAIEIECRRPARTVTVRADRTDLKRALQALIENAVKFTPDHGRVEVAAQVDGDRVCFSVTDTGIGIDPRYHKRIFEKFFQVEDPLTRHHGGAGLGLFVARGIIEAHGSKIEVKSELGQGASFLFRIAAVPGSARPVPVAVAGGAASSETPVRARA